MNSNQSCFSFGRYDHRLQLPTFRTTLSVFYSITSLSAVTLNFLILYSVWKNPPLHKPSYLLLESCIHGLLFGAIAEPLTVFAYHTYLKNWTIICCYLSFTCHFFSYWLVSISLYSLALISIDRLLAIRLKNRYRSFVTSHRIRMVTIPYWIGMFVFLLALFLSNIPFIVINIISTMCIFVFLVTITTCYSMAFYSLKKITSSVSSSNQQPDNGPANFDVSRYRRSLNTMVIVVLTTLMLYLPYVFSVVANAIANGESYQEDSFSMTTYKMLKISEFIVAANSTVNPLVYLWRMRDIREAVKSTVFKLLRQEHHSDQGEQA